MKRFTMCKGLPASGKSSWAEAEVLKDPVSTARVNMDLIRMMLHCEWYNGKPALQDRVITMRNAVVATLMQTATPHIISDDTNLHPSAESTWRTLCRQYGYELVIKDFTDVPVKTCIERDLKRSRSVGSKVIQRMYSQYLEAPWQPAPFDAERPWCVVVDIDGTLAHIVPGPNGKKRSPYDWSRVGEDAVDEVVRDLVADAINRGDIVIVLSGRDGVCEPETRKWLDDSVVVYDELYMRAAGDQRKDSIVKSEIFDTHIGSRFNVRYVIDDRDQVVEMWRARGLKVLQVAEGDF